MKPFVVFLVAVLTAAAMLGAFPASVGADHAVPFKGSVQYTLTVTVEPDGTILVKAVGTGQATHLGRLTAEASAVVHVDPTTGEVTVSVTAVYTAANGDQLSFSGEGRFISPTTDVGTFRITGGSGRFTDATGGETMWRSSQILPIPP